jgi:hypothetical protein
MRLLRFDQDIDHQVVIEGSLALPVGHSPGRRFSILGAAAFFHSSRSKENAISYNEVCLLIL